MVAAAAPTVATDAASGCPSAAASKRCSPWKVVAGGRGHRNGPGHSSR